MTRFRSVYFVLAALTASAAIPVSAQVASPAADVAAPADGLSYADVADLVLASPVIVDATIRSTARIKPAEAVGLAPGRERLYVEADTGVLIRGRGGVPPRVGYLLDVQPDAAGRLPRLKKTRVLVFARDVAGAAGQLQLSGPNAQQPWTPALDATVRAIATEAVAADQPPRITGVGNAFHVPGALPGEGETQIFLTTADARPVSLSILRRPGERPRWAVALSEIVDESAAAPRPATLLWYRLACSLPPALPDRSTAQLSPEDAAAAREDYRFVLNSLGTCGRTQR